MIDRLIRIIKSRIKPYRIIEAWKEEYKELLDYVQCLINQLNEQDALIEDLRQQLRNAEQGEASAWDTATKFRQECQAWNTWLNEVVCLSPEEAVRAIREKHILEAEKEHERIEAFIQTTGCFDHIKDPTKYVRDMRDDTDEEP